MTNEDQKYVLVGWPDIQYLMDHPRWSECIFCMDLEEHPVEDSTYAVPEDLYQEMLGGWDQKINLTEEQKSIIRKAAALIKWVSAKIEDENVNPENLDEQLLDLLD